MIPVHQSLHCKLNFRKGKVLATIYTFVFRCYHLCLKQLCLCVLLCAVSNPWLNINLEKYSLQIISLSPKVNPNPTLCFCSPQTCSYRYIDQSPAWPFPHGSLKSKMNLTPSLIWGEKKGQRRLHEMLVKYLVHSLENQSLANQSSHHAEVFPWQIYSGSPWDINACHHKAAQEYIHSPDPRGEGWTRQQLPFH